MRRFLAVSLLFLNVLLAGNKKAAERRLGPPTMGNEVVDVTAEATIDHDAVAKKLGMDPGYNILVLDVKVAPKGDNKIQVYRDDFTLVLARDGQRSQPMDPGQIAGKGAMVVSQQSVSNGGGMGQSRGPIWGGIPGTGGRPSQMPGNGGGIGNAGSSSTEAKATIQNGGSETDNPLLKVLKSKVLPEKETNESVSGLLYFIFEGKPPKTKDLTLIYKSPAGRLLLEFDPKK